MKIFSAKQIRDIDEYTIKHTPIESIDLMENASRVFFKWFIDKINYSRQKKITVICGKGNNGGDGLAVARMLHDEGFNVRTCVIEGDNSSSLDFRSNLYKLQQLEGVKLKMLYEDQPLDLDIGDYVIDAIFGSGLSREISGFFEKILVQINYADTRVFSIDIPSGLFADGSSSGPCVNSDETLSFQFPKLAFMFSENAEQVKSWETLSIGLHPTKIENSTTRNFYVDGHLIKRLIRSRGKFDHKGSYGHAQIVAGSKGMMGAAVLAAKSCLRSGVGLLSLQIPAHGNIIMQTAVPEAMVKHESEGDHINKIEADKKIDAIGIGPGLGRDTQTLDALSTFLDNYDKPVVLDADALNLIAEKKTILDKIPEGSILTPHVKEFERLFGSTSNDFDRHRLQQLYASKYKVFIVLKGAHSCTATPTGESYFNSTGNNGMATAGSGDVLTGVITSLLAQGYDSQTSCLLGVYAHGLAGDLAAAEVGHSGLIASDIIGHLPLAFKTLSNGS